MSDRKRNVVVTGFGPFGVHKVNNSWECVKELKSSDLESSYDVRLILVEIPVVYDTADKVVPELWQEHRPILMVHVGVHGGDNVVVERQARNGGYSRLDVNNSFPEDGVCPLGGEETICTRLDVDSFLCEDVVCSTDAGRYLCEYTYYLSLSRDPSRTLFVHVPPCDGAVSKEIIVDRLASIIKKCLGQLEEIN